MQLSAKASMRVRRMKPTQRKKELHDLADLVRSFRQQGSLRRRKFSAVPNSPGAAVKERTGADA
jgi:hypothetical protein